MKKFFLALCALIVGMAANAEEYYLVGNSIGWDASETGHFTPAEDGTYVLDYEGTLTSGFKINNGSWNTGVNFGSNGSNLVLGEPYHYVNDTMDDINLAASVANPHCVLDIAAGTLTITTTSAPVESVITYGVKGQIFDGTNWTTKEMNEAEDGTWTLTAKVVAGEFGIQKLENGTQIAFYKSASGTDVKVNEAMLASTSGTNWSSALAGEYTFVFDPEAMTLTIQGETPVDPDPVDPVDPVYSYGLHGSVFTGSWETREMAAAEDGTWTLTATLVAGEFGIMPLKDGQQDNYRWIAADGETTVSVNTAMHAKENGSNWSSTLEGKYTFVFDPAAMTLTIKGEETPVDPDPVDPVDPVYSYGIHGSVFTGSWETREMTEAEDGTWTLTATLVAGEFGIMPLKDGKQDNNGWIAAANGMTEAVVGIAMTATSENCSNWVSALAGEYTFVFNPTEMTLTIQGKTPVDPDPVDPELPAHVYIVGNLATGSWDTANAPELTFGDDTKLFTIENIQIMASSDDSNFGYFSFITVQGSDWDTEVNNGDRYGAPAADTELTVPSTTEVTLYKAGVNASAAASWKVEAGFYNIVLDLAAMTINITKSESSAADLELGNEEAPVYFNLQGVQVAEPTAGLYIEVRGNQVRKVMIK